MNVISKVTKALVQSIAAGVCIGIGTITYLQCSSNIAGAFLFSIGLFAICTYGLRLFTGSIGYLFTKDGYRYLVTTLIGNTIGVSLTALLARVWNQNIQIVGNNILQTKLHTNPLEIFISAIFCGMLMFIAVDMYRYGHAPTKYLGIFICVPCFIICGFDHCIANGFYVMMAESKSQLIMGSELFATTMGGNSLGAILMFFLLRKINFWRIHD